MSVSWRDAAAPVIAKALADTKGKPEAEIRKALFDAYPFGERAHHPYAVWLSEIKIQRKQRPPLGTFGPRKKAVATDPRQGGLF